MNAPALLELLAEELDRFRVSAEDPTSEPVTIDMLGTILVRALREASDD